MQKVARYVSFGFSTHGPISAATPKPATVAWLQLSASTMVLQVHGAFGYKLGAIVGGCPCNTSPATWGLY